MTDETPMETSQAEQDTTPSRRSLVNIAVALLLLCAVAVLGYQYSITQTLKAVTQTTEIDPEGGEIVVTYRFAVSQPQFDPDYTQLLNANGEAVEARFASWLEEDGIKEVIRFKRPTPFNQTLTLNSALPPAEQQLWHYLGVAPLPRSLSFNTIVEQVSLNDLLPTTRSQHAPEALNNQIAIVFNGHVGTKFRKRVKLQPQELPFISLTPEPTGYYQWSDNQTLTFNFTAEKPRFDTTYRFDIEPDKLINADFQVWSGDTSLALTTTSNDVYVSDVSFENGINWNTPITFEFSGNMVGVFDLNKDKSNAVMPVKMTPQVDGRWRWINAKTVRFTPSEQGWPVRSEIEVTFLPEVNRESDRNWTNNRDLNTSRFVVRPRTQSIHNVSLRGENVDPEAVLDLKFSRPLVPQGLVGTKIDLDANAPIVITPAIDGQYHWKSTDELRFEPATPWSELTEYQVSLSPGFNPDPRFEWKGTTTLNFTTAENVIRPVFYRIPGVAPSGTEFFGNKAQYALTDTVHAEESIWLEFNRPFGKHYSQDGVASGIQFKPAIEGKFVWLSDYLLSFTPAKGWQPETRYEVSLTKELLYFHQQHYAKGSEKATFTVPKDTINVQVKPKYQPDEIIQLVFNKSLKLDVKVGRSYSSSKVVAELLPLQWNMERDYQFEWKTASLLELTPKTYWPPEKEVTLTLSDELLPREHSHWDQQDYKIATTKNRVALRFVRPAGKIQRNTDLEVTFDKNIRPADLAIGDKDTSGLVQVTPAITGDWRWTADNRLTLQPSEPLAPSTDYSVTVSPAKIASAEFTWNDLDEDGVPRVETRRFHTPYQRVKESQASFEFDDENPLKQRFLIDIELSEWTTFDEVEKRFTLWTNNVVDGKTVEVPLIYNITTEQPKNKVKNFRVISDFVDRPNENRRVYYQIDKGVPAVGGNATMYNNYASNFLQEKPRFIDIRSIYYRHQNNRFNARLRLNAPIEPEKLKRFLTVAEAGSGTELDYHLSVDSSSSSSGSFYYLVEADFQPDTRYSYTIKEGLLAADGALTNKLVKDIAKTDNLERIVEFAHKGNILPRYDSENIRIKTTNANRFQLSVDQIYASNIREYLNNGLSNRGGLGSTGKEIFRKSYSVKKIHSDDVHNKELITEVDLAELFSKNRKGLYRLQLLDANKTSSRWFLSSDIALVARRTGQHVYAWALSLNTAKPLAGVQVELVDSWNQSVSSGKTDASGFVRLKNSDPNNSHVLLANRGDEVSFLDLRSQQESFTGYDVQGVMSSQDASLLQAYIYGERGVYRPGDKVHTIAVVRDQDGALPNKAVVVAKLKDPTGTERYSERFTVDNTGVVVLDYDMPVDARTGNWQAELYWRQQNIGTRKFKVEEFIPNKIKVELDTASARALPGKTFKFDVQANNLFGPPSAGRKVNANISLRPAYFKPKGFERYTFGHDDHRFQQLDSDLLETRLDDKGHYQYEYSVPENIDSPIGLNLHYSATVIDDSGRGVSQYAKIPVQLFEQYVGIQKLTDKTAEIGELVTFETVNVTAAGEAVASDERALRYEVYRKRKVTHFRKNERGYYRYVTEKVDVPLIKQDSSEQKFSYRTEFSGEHYLQVTDLNGGQVSRHYFNVSGPRSNVSLVEAPDKIMMRARTKQALRGETIEVDIQAPFAGRLMLFAERDDVMWSKTIEMSASTMRVSIPVKADYFPNFYLSAMVVKPASQGSKDQPVYAKGLLNINVQDPKRRPQLTIDAPAKVSPNGKLVVKVATDRLDNGPMYFTLAAVDEGILDLTRFKTPDMTAAFARKQRLDVSHYSIYPWVVPFEDEILASISPSGSAPARALIKKKRVNPEAAARVKSVALWSGLQKFDADGTATVSFDVPEFDGSLRLMLVSFGDQRFSSTEQRVVVRDDLVLKPSLPRFMANGDHFELPFTLFNSTDNTGDIQVSIEHDEKVDLLGNERINVRLPAAGETTGSFSFNVGDVLGVSHFTLRATGLGEETVKRISVPVRSAGNYISLSNTGLVDRATPHTVEIPQVFRPGTEVQALRVAPAGLLEYKGSLKYLLQYPHGCLEQTTSKLFPLLYFEEFAKNADFYEFRSNTPRHYLRQGINRIERMQLENGYFSYWSGSHNINNYAFLYAAHFLAEARNKGLEVNATVWNKMQRRLSQDVLNKFDAQAGYSGRYRLSHQVYALYVLALAGNANISEMNALLQHHKRKLKPHDRARLAAAFMLAGRQSTANELVADITSIGEYDDPYRETSGTFASNSRDLAVLLDALIEVQPNADVVPLVVDKLSSQRYRGRWRSTQDNALALMALGKAVTKASKIQKGDVIVTLPSGEKVVNRSVDLSTVDLLAGNVRIETTGEAEANYYWQADGISASSNSGSEDHGLRVRRQYLNTEQQKVDLNNIRQGELVIVQLSLSSTAGTVHNVAVTDLLPMGLEIENARLSTSADIPWLSSTAEPDHTDIRDDRMNLYMTLNEKEVVYYYTTRAVTVGNFAIPAVRAEAMYDEDKYSLSGQSSMKVLPMQ
ncbi:hypothetical protein CHH28_03955 [Bacterioplanes sanyensis]|uniref:Alpha-2-macroglobulin n=1 Tax=Bacterioplanes sanyensis TaxID=1249553 RepID=A0A222FGK7_9GAMM|nr:MG2 domain-containing protein [Bacterioplanes sanyensis]ASP37879.1 hypothetical protein CHH28_03955 [Bacterioplanes sanyensis]